MCTPASALPLGWWLDQLNADFLSFLPGVNLKERECLTGPLADSVSTLKNFPEFLHLSHSALLLFENGLQSFLIQWQDSASLPIIQSNLNPELPSCPVVVDFNAINTWEPFMMQIKASCPKLH